LITKLTDAPGDRPSVGRWLVMSRVTVNGSPMQMRRRQRRPADRVLGRVTALRVVGGGVGADDGGGPVEFGVAAHGSAQLVLARHVDEMDAASRGRVVELRELRFEVVALAGEVVRPPLELVDGVGDEGPRFPQGPRDLAGEFVAVERDAFPRDPHEVVQGDGVDRLRSRGEAPRAFQGVVVDPPGEHEVDALAGLHRLQVREGVEGGVELADGAVQLPAQIVGVVGGLRERLPAGGEEGDEADEKALAERGSDHGVSLLPRCGRLGTAPWLGAPARAGRVGGVLRLPQSMTAPWVQGPNVLIVFRFDVHASEGAHRDGPCAPRPVVGRAAGTMWTPKPKRAARRGRGRGRPHRRASSLEALPWRPSTPSACVAA
jgi:hypothetical protein